MKIIPTILLFKNFVLNNYSKRSYSQEGEDLIIRRLFEKNNKGFYIDIGAHHPLRFSNTYLLYKKGWHGINIDATPGSMASFKILRPRDINIEVGIDNAETTKTIYLFNESAVNTFDPLVAKHNVKSGYKLINKKNVRITKLSTIFSKYVRSKKIDLLNIDVEGLDYFVLQSNDWGKYHPSVIIVEVHEIKMEDLFSSKVGKMLSKIGYQLFAKTSNSLIFVDNKLI